MRARPVFAAVLLIGATPYWSLAQSSGPTSSSGPTASSGSNQPMSAATHCRAANGEVKLKSAMAGTASGGTTGAASGTGSVTDRSDSKGSAAAPQKGSSATIPDLTSC
jgi:hypothetical protein